MSTGNEQQINQWHVYHDRNRGGISPWADGPGMSTHDPVLPSAVASALTYGALETNRPRIGLAQLESCCYLLKCRAIKSIVELLWYLWVKS